MSQAEALLNSMMVAAVDETEHTNSVFTEVEPHIVIGIDRFINVPDQLKRIAVQYDHNMRTVTFDCPRYYDGRDMSKMKVYINIAGPKGTRSSYIADNVKVDEYDTNIMHFDWTITRAITEVNGNIAFLVCVRKADGEGNEENHWNSELNTDMYISEGLEYEETFEYEYPDIVTQLLQRMDAVEVLATPESMQGFADTWLNTHGDEFIAGVQAKGDEVLATIPADYTVAASNADEGVRTKADAIIRTVEGNVITVDDSSDDYLRSLRVFGKTTQVKTTGAQLLELPVKEQHTDRGLTQNVIGGICTVKGTTNSTSAFNLTLAGSYTSTTTLFTLPAGTYTATDCSVCNYDGVNRKTYSNTFSISEPVDITWVLTRSYAVNETVNETTYPMLNVGSTALAWEPYTGGVVSPNPNYPQQLSSVVSPVISVYGKNLIKPYGSTRGGYTASVNDDGSVTITGAADTTDDIYVLVAACNDTHPIVLRDGVDYYMWGESSNGRTIGTKSINVYGDPQWSFIENWNAHVRKYCNKVVQLYVESTGHKIGDTSLCGTYRFQLEIGNKFTGFEKYTEQVTSIDHTLPGIPVSQNGNYTDKNGEQWICDEVDFERGVYVKRVGQTVLTGMEGGWYLNGAAANGDTRLYQIPLVSYNGIKQSNPGSVCTHMSRSINTFSSDDVSFCVYNTSGKTYIRMRHGATDLNEFKAFLTAQYNSGNPVTIYYESEEAVETPLSAEELETFRQLRSNYHVTTVMNDSGAQMEFKYNADTEIYIDNVIKNAMMKVTDITLPFANWNGTTYGYYQSVAVNGVTSNSKIDLQPTPDQLATFVRTGVSLTTSNNNGIVTIHAIGNCPTSDITLQVQITEVAQV